MEQYKSCHYCGHFLTLGEREYRCDKDGLGGEVIPRFGNGKMTLWKKLECYKKSGEHSKLSLRLMAEAWGCENWDGGGA